MSATRTTILGISAFYHDSAAALIVNGEVTAAAQEERFTRKKHDASFPVNAIGYCLKQEGIDASELDYVVFYEKPLLKFERILETYLATVPRSFRSFLHAMPTWFQQKLHLPREIHHGLQGKYRKQLIFVEHHESHAASAFYPSPFNEAAILTVDGVGEWATASLGTGTGRTISLNHELRFPHSLGLLYSAFTYYCGFSVNSGEYKLMGLAPYGKPVFADLILTKLISLREDGSFRMDMSYFNYCQGLTMTSEKFASLFGGPPRKPESPLSERVLDVAASVQKVAEIIVGRMANFLHCQFPCDNLCLAGGVALNCVANGLLLKQGPFKNLWIQPAAGDAGGALGAALFVWHDLLEHERTPKSTDSQKGSLLGPEYSDNEIREALDAECAVYYKCGDDSSTCEAAASLLAEGKVVAWFQGRMEYGPRSLGNRSILGDPRNPKMQQTINLKVKLRESFRPFAPAVMKERAVEYFELGDHESPYMLLVAAIQKDKLLEPSGAEKGLSRISEVRSSIPAVTHIDSSARVQTVDAERNLKFYSLISAFEKRTGCPVIVNTSFNIRGEPVVCTPSEAYRCFLCTDIDALVVGQFILLKESQPKTRSSEERNRYLAAFGKD